MNKKVKILLVIGCAAVLLIVFYRPLFVRRVNYEIGGIKIPSEYNILTGKARPILDYKGKAITRTVKDKKIGKVGLSEDQVVLAQFRWAIFEEWADSHPEYKGWQNNAEMFKRANDAFRKELDTAGPKFRIVK